MHEKRTRMIFTVDPPLLSTMYSYIRVDNVTKSIYIFENMKFYSNAFSSPTLSYHCATMNRIFNNLFKLSITYFKNS